MKLYWSKNTRAFRIAWLMEEVGAPYDRVVVDINDPASKNDAAFRAVSPMGKVPVLVDGATHLTDSGAICIYVADQVPAARLAPPIGHADRGAYLQWVTFTNSVIEPSMSEKFAKLAPNPRSYGWGSFEMMLDVLRAGVAKGPWVLGDHFTAADVLLGTSCQYLKRFGLADDPVLAAYAERCAARPAWKRARAFDAA